jgi:hypothetical protein
MSLQHYSRHPRTTNDNPLLTDLALRAADLPLVPDADELKRFGLTKLYRRWRFNPSRPLQEVPFSTIDATVTARWGTETELSEAERLDYILSHFNLEAATSPSAEEEALRRLDDMA